MIFNLQQMMCSRPMLIALVPVLVFLPHGVDAFFGGDSVSNDFGEATINGQTVDVYQPDVQQGPHTRPSGTNNSSGFNTGGGGSSTGGGGSCGTYPAGMTGCTCSEGGRDGGNYAWRGCRAAPPPSPPSPPPSTSLPDLRGEIMRVTDDSGRADTNANSGSGNDLRGYYNLTLRGRVTNSGAASNNRSFVVHWDIQNRNTGHLDRQTKSWASYSIARGANRERNEVFYYSTHGFPPGNYRARMVVDPTGRVPESNNGNNVSGWFYFNIAPPDLSPAHISFVSDGIQRDTDRNGTGPTLLSGRNLTVQVPIWNLSSLTHNRQNFTAYFEIFPTNAGAVSDRRREVHTHNRYAISTRSSRNYAENFSVSTHSLPPGDYRARVWVDPTNTVRETNNGNNVSSWFYFTIVPGCDPATFNVERDTITARPGDTGVSQTYRMTRNSEYCYTGVYDTDGPSNTTNSEWVVTNFNFAGDDDMVFDNGASDPDGINVARQYWGFDIPASAPEGTYIMRGEASNPMGGANLFDTFRLIIADDAPPPPPVTPTLPQCSDGIDNDGDGDIDLADGGCDDANDDDETDTLPPPPTEPDVSAGSPVLTTSDLSAESNDDGAFVASINSLGIGFTDTINYTFELDLDRNDSIDATQSGSQSGGLTAVGTAGDSLVTTPDEVFTALPAGEHRVRLNVSAVSGETVTGNNVSGWTTFVVEPPLGNGAPAITADGVPGQLVVSPNYGPVLIEWDTDSWANCELEGLGLPNAATASETPYPGIGVDGNASVTVESTQTFRIFNCTGGPSGMTSDEAVLRVLTLPDAFET